MRRWYRNKKSPILFSGISLSGVGKDIHLHGFDWLLLFMNNQADILGGFPAENLFAAARANLRGNVFHKNGFPVNLKNFANEFGA